MTDLKDIRHVYFIGIGGIGMSALARFFRSRGVKVSGYDRSATPLTKELEESGCFITFVDDAAGLPTDVDIVVFTPAIPAENAIRSFYTGKGYPMLKRSDVLQIVSKDSFNICIAGTHGKTTISTMTAHLLRHSGYGCNAFLGGISANYQTNFWSDERNTCVIEADEYDRSFLKLSPDLAVVSAMDPDHLDIYGTAEAMEEAFIEFSSRLRPGGTLFCRKGLKREQDLKAPRQFSYAGNDAAADIHVSGLRVEDGAYRYAVHHGDWTLDGLVLHMGGLHNVENSVAAIAIAHQLGIGDQKIREAVAAFRGVRRRFEQVVNGNGRIYVDDYAHHPEELRALIEGARSLFTGKKCTVVFQPHLYSRTRDLAEGFAQSLDLADEVVLLPIYPAREKPMEGVNAEMIASRMKNPRHRVMGKEELLQVIGTERPELLITAGAGDIDQLIAPIREIMEKTTKQ
jgi:UDP-N-acetylmuramate--alanine ligase